MKERQVRLSDTMASNKLLVIGHGAPRGSLIPGKFDLKINQSENAVGRIWGSFTFQVMGS